MIGMAENRKKESKRISKLRKLGEGSYGCVVSHPLPCSGKETVISTANKERKEVAKLFYEKDKFNKEVSLAKKVKKVDPSEEKMLVATKACPVSKKVLEDPLNASAISKCEVLGHSVSDKDDVAPVSKNVWQIAMPYSGVQLDKAVQRYKRHIPVKTLASMIAPLFEAIILLQQSKLVHQDIKYENVLVQKKKALLIDFSLMMSYDRIYTLANYNRLRRRYRSFPPEYYMVSLMMKYQNDIEGSDKDYIKMFLLDKYKVHLERIQYFFGAYYTLSEIIEKSNSKSLLQELFDNGNKAMKKYANKIDVFAVGTMLNDIHPYVKRPMENVEYLRLMRGLLHPDPRERLTAEEALTACKKIAGV